MPPGSSAAGRGRDSPSILLAANRETGSFPLGREAGLPQIERRAPKTRILLESRTRPKIILLKWQLCGKGALFPSGKVAAGIVARPVQRFCGL